MSETNYELCVDELQCFLVSYEYWSQETYREDIQENAASLIRSEKDAMFIALSFDDVVKQLNSNIGHEIFSYVINEVIIEKIERIDSISNISESAYEKIKSSNWYNDE
jgi:transcriptional regulator NrdR family protein